MMRPNLPSGGRQAALNEALDQARFALQTNRPYDAERIAAEVLRTNSGHREASKILGYALINSGRASEAVAPLEKAARGSHDSELETALAVALRQTGRNDDAVSWLRRAIKRNPPFPLAFYELGVLLGSMRQLGEAIDVMKRGIAVAPMMVDMIAQLGSFYNIVNDAQNAADCFRRALAINPAHYASMEALGIVLMNSRQYAEAADIFRRMVAANPDDVNARISLANCLLGLGDDEMAFACLRAASDRGPRPYGQVLRVLASSRRGRFWLRPSAARKFLKDSPT